MQRDPIVEEVRAIRDAFAREHGYDLELIVTTLQEERARSGRQAVSLPPKRLQKTKAERKAG